MAVAAWESELEGDPDRDFLLDGIRNGFHIVDPHAPIQPSSLPNHKSALDNYDATTSLIAKEIELGRYAVASIPPTIVSPLGLIPKTDNGHRLIHDCSAPSGRSVNDSAVHCDKQTYESIDTAVDYLKSGYFMAKVDIKSAYRAVAIHPASYRATGLSWTIDGERLVLIDKRLPFGARPAPSIFHRLSQSIKRMMARRGHTSVIAYQDDFLVIAESYDTCLQAWMDLIRLILKLGFDISYSKLAPPSTDMTFLGVRLRSDTMTLSLPPDKLTSIKSCLHNFKSRTRATKRQLQSLAGKLNHASRVVRGGRTFIRRLLTAIHKLRMPHHKARIQGALLGDISWWCTYIDRFNGTAAVINAESAASVLTDACPIAGGAFYGGDFIYTQWEHDHAHVAAAPINYKEAMMAALSVTHWASEFTNRVVYVYSDNQCTVSIINKCSSRDEHVMKALRDMFWASAKYNFVVRAIYTPGARHIIADTISRIHEPGQIHALEAVINNWYKAHWPHIPYCFDHVSFASHMSLSSLISILPQVAAWRRLKSSWTTWWHDTVWPPSQTTRRHHTAPI